jgi:hypothetical protein
LRARLSGLALVFPLLHAGAIAGKRLAGNQRAASEAKKFSSPHEFISQMESQLAALVGQSLADLHCFCVFVQGLLVDADAQTGTHW